MMRALFSAISGMRNHMSYMDVIGNNIANVNTTAYKRNQVNFADVVTSQAVKGRYSAGGVQGITRQYVSQQGLIQARINRPGLNRFNESIGE